MKQWYEELFENYALGYERELFTQGTVQEVDFIEDVIGHARSLRILDIGCGTGRHSIELAKRGYTVAGMNFEILRNARNASRTPGKLILTTLNALFPLKHSVDEFINTASEKPRSAKSVFDLTTFRMASEFESTDDKGVKKILKCNERYYAPSEITWQLKSLGFMTIDIYGCTPGQFSRGRALSPDDFEMLVIAGC